MIDLFWSPFAEFAFMRHALLGCVALSLGAAPVGVFLLLRRMSLTGDAMAHAILPGAAIGYLLFGLSLILQVIAPPQWFPAFDLDLGLFTLPIVQGWVVPLCMVIGACGMSLAMPNISAMISRASPPDRQGAMLGLNMASSSVARIFGPMIAGALFSGLGHDWPFVIGALLTIGSVIWSVVDKRGR